MALLAAVTLVVALSEGLGFVLLAPMLGALGGMSEGGVPEWLPRLAFAPLLMLFVGLVALRTLTELWRALIAQRIEVELVDGLRIRTMERLLHAEWRYLSQASGAGHRALVLGTVERAGRAVHLFADLLRLALGLGALAIAAFVLAPLAALALALSGAAIFVAFAPLRRRAHMLGETLGRRYEAMFAAVGETLAAMRVVKSLSREPHALERLGTSFAGRRETERRFILDSGIAKALLQTVGAGLLALFVWLAYARFAIPLATLLPLVAIFARAVPMFGQLQQAAQDWAHDRPAIEEVEALISEAELHAEPPAKSEAPRLTRSLDLRGISLAYAEGRPALAQTDLTLPQGSITAITGPSGAGKSTLADIAGGLLAPDSGSVVLDGVDLSDGDRIAWRRRVAYVQQDPVLFAASLRENMHWGRADASDEDIAAALQAASAAFALELPGGLDHIVGDTGQTLSGGERQRIALARALLRQPDLLILDEATSAVDPASELAIAKAVKHLAGQCTILVIGHRGALTEIASRRFEMLCDRLGPAE